MDQPIRSPHRTEGQRTRRRRQIVYSLVGILMLGLTVLLSRPSVSAQTDVRVMVTIYKVWERGCYGEDTFAGCVGGEDADFYTVTYVDGQRFETSQIEDESSIEPGWQFAKTVAQDSLVPVTIEMWDSDGGLRGDDDHIDLTAGDGKNLGLTIVIGKDAGACQVGGNFPGGKAKCGQRISDGGNDDEDAAGIEFSVDVVYPTRVGRTSISCTHSPLWPQPGQAVTINAAGMDIETGFQPTAVPGMPPAFGGLPHIYNFSQIAVDKLQIWFSADSANPNRVKAAECVRPATGGGCQAVVNPTGAAFQYGCWLENPGVTVASNYREVTVGIPPGANIVPVLYQQPKERAIDLVIYPDGGVAARAPSSTDRGIGAATGYPNGWTDAQFLTDASNVVNGALLEPVLLQYQSRINIWISQRTGAPGWPPTGTGGTTNNGIGLSDGKGREAFADVAEIIHRRQISNGAPVPSFANTRDAAGGGMFTVNALRADGSNVMRHEMGHAVFGLADEYCCDGGYGVANPFPNVYNSLGSCMADFADLNKINTELKWPTQGPCRAIPQVTVNPLTATPTPGVTPTPASWVSDASSFVDGLNQRFDLMNNNDYGMTSDIRRFRWTFDKLCPEGGC